MAYARKDAERTEDGRVCVKNPSAFWLPEFSLQKATGGTVYSVTGAYDGTETRIGKWSASWRKSLRIKRRIGNDKFADAWYNGNIQSCTGSCPFEGGNRNVAGN